MAYKVKRRSYLTFTMTGHYDEGFPDSRELVKSDHLTPFLADDLSFFFFTIIRDIYKK